MPSETCILIPTGTFFKETKSLPPSSSRSKTVLVGCIRSPLVGTQKVPSAELIKIGQMSTCVNVIGMGRLGGGVGLENLSFLEKYLGGFMVEMWDVQHSLLGFGDMSY